MLNTIIIPARSLQKSYKSIIEDVKNKNRPAILTTNKEPQAAIISLEDLEELKKARARLSALDMLKMVIDNREELKVLPANLRDKANDILYSKSL